MKIINSINNVKSKDITRSVINSIYLDKDNQKVVATNGNILVALKPTEEIKETKLVKLPKMPGKVLDLDQDTLSIKNDKGLSASSELVEGMYPQWQKVLCTDKTPVLTIGLDAKLLQELCTALLEHSGKKSSILKFEFYDETTPPTIRADDSGSIGVIMPCRFDF